MVDLDFRVRGSLQSWDGTSGGPSPANSFGRLVASSGLPCQDAAPIPMFSAFPQTAVRAECQVAFGYTRENVATLSLPGPHAEVMPGVLWGQYDTLFTPAYWRVQVWFWGLEGQLPRSHALGRSLAEEVAACLLGGYGIPAEVGLAAFEHLRERGLLGPEPPSTSQCYTALSEPLRLGARQVRYRFARQKSRYLSGALRTLAEAHPPSEGHQAFRDWLAAIPGLGPKTASWVTRNWLDSDAVAILDVHIHRAGLLAGFFLPRHTLPNDYAEMEERFLRFAHSIGVRPAIVDALIWRDMKCLGTLAHDLERARALRACLE